MKINYHKNVSAYARDKIGANKLFVKKRNFYKKMTGKMQQNYIENFTNHYI